MQNQPPFIINSTYHREESKDIEFKSIASQHPVKKIVNHAEEYITGFLNALVEGQLYIGIDDAGKILGVKLSRSERDEIQKIIPNKLRNTDPIVSPSLYDIAFYNVLNEEQKDIEDLFVVNISVLGVDESQFYRTSSREYFLYKTTGGSTYLKTGTDCIKLNTTEIAQEIQKRKQKYLKQELDNIDDKLLQNPDNRSLLKEKANIAKLMGDIEKMDESYKRLINLNPNNSRTRVDYASAHKSIGDLEGALDILEDALKVDGDNLSILKTKGEILLGSDSSDKVKEAFQTYETALKLNPEDYTIITQIGIALRKLGKYKESIKVFNLALAKSPHYRAAKYEKRITYHKMFEGGIRI
ncbi:TPR repeat protein [Trichormus variabilis ATCC 29413]|uniref:TPR repeat protein n=3 Tax=Anabaena variabilis TaxID=264691 RepID=Q3M823_TRIV2|nr:MULTISPECIES: ATP-binding protein [Nostocaceae]MBC1258724.1 putative DNA binding domain-containing protein [Trichormus variabilis V5]ABA22863.1 TPR repeat protein [Trichormus variabilis ATCC 29413]MBC1212933.1 putative DNA binding domain-containing protein [Trichormus variabilis ARAD]MBC1270432.1 putative DNA binding domain-containing protein [Trichormus variabilis FSR]MBC1302564.1 putative DNA binding domain-containing protein [Trichormus variabilis N2B]